MKDHHSKGKRYGMIYGQQSWGQLSEVHAVVRQVYAVVIAVAVVAALNHHLQLYLQLCLA